MMKYPFADMPELAPLPMAPQCFTKAPEAKRDMDRAKTTDRLWRFAAFVPAILTTFGYSSAIADRLSQGGITLAEFLVIALVAITFIWISISVSTVVLGLVRRSVQRRSKPRQIPKTRFSQNVALLIPLYNETPSDVFGNAAAMIQELAVAASKDQFSLFLLSDTQDAKTARQEELAFEALKSDCPKGFEVFYRRRGKNVDKKVGNLTDWIENWGAAYEAMIVLDADSLMSGAAIRQLADEMAADPEAGLIQSFPRLIGSVSLFGRMQQFSNAVYGWLLAEGLAAWTQREGNYWGHNAIIRTRAFAESARLPYLKGRGGKSDLILSHDFVEAGMLRRAGWAVKFLPTNVGSYEETPQTLIDYVLRDRRWCHGNLQHLRLLAARGFHPVSRFHLLHGAVAFLLSPAWLAMIIIWSMLGSMPIENPSYFSPLNPLQPMWPKTIDIYSPIYLFIIYTMLLLPKLIGLFWLGMRSRIRLVYGGWFRFAATGIFEIICAIAYAPILMVQQTIAVFSAVIGRTPKWNPQKRNANGYGWSETFRFHWLETLIGIVMLSQIVLGDASLWLLSIAISLVLAVPLSRLSGISVSDRTLSFLRLDSPQSLCEPRIMKSAREKRNWIKAVLLLQPVDSEMSEHQGSKIQEVDPEIVAAE